MIELLTTHIEAILAAIGLIGGTGVITWGTTRKKAKADAMKSVQDVYQETIKDLREDKALMKEDIREMRGELEEIRITLKANSKEIKLLKKDRCTKHGCKERTRE